MVKNRIKSLNIINDIFMVLVLLAVFFLPNKADSLNKLGILIFSISIINILIFYNNKKLSLLIGIISLISISYSFSVCFNPVASAYNWQIELINLSQNIIMVKSYLLFITFLFLFIKNVDDNIQDFNIANNSIVFYAGYIILFLILVLCFNAGSSSTYTSNTSALYEYAIVIFMFCWIYSKNVKLRKFLLIFYSILYCLNSLRSGDRSSAFPMILLMLVFLLKNKINMKYVLIFGFCGIILGNTIDVLRNNNYNFSLNVLKIAGSNMMNVNTISYSHYAGVQIVRYGDSSDDKMSNFINYNLSYFLGNTKKHDLAQITRNKGYINKGGGFSSTYFYYWFGYFGIIIFAFFIASIINFANKNKNNLSQIILLLITIFSIRWIVYFPTALFRTSIIVPSIAYALIKLFDKMLRKEKI